jgi:hypothetical protein
MEYVMVDEKYTTVSDDDVSGWLGIMIGDNLWHPYFDDADADKIADTVEEKCHAFPDERGGAAADTCALSSFKAGYGRCQCGQQ